jgi:hypothetical protein
MRHTSTIIACLALMLSKAVTAEADPIPGTITLTAQEGGSQLTGPPPATYTGTVADLSAPSSYVMLSGPELGYSSGYAQGTMNIPIQATFNMTISFDGASGSQPTVDVAGTLTGSYVVSTIPPSNPLYAEGYNLTGELNLGGTVTSATLQGWTTDSGVPMSLINQYLNTSSYNIYQQVYTGPYMASVVLPNTAVTNVDINLSTATAAPEPATILVYATSIAGLGLQRFGRRRRSRAA